MSVPEESGRADLWEPLRRHTPARVGLGRTGHGLPLRHLLEFQAAHAQARDAVHQPVDFAALRPGLTGHPVAEVRSAVPDRAAYLRRPDLGRRLHPEDGPRLAGLPGGGTLVVIADGLSATAVQRHALPLLDELVPLLAGPGGGGRGSVPVVLASQARVALGDEIGERVGARLVLVLIGERPGLSAADSLGVYLTYAPRTGRRDAERNCVSNIHPPAGLGYRAAARTIASLAEGAMRLGLSGVALSGEEPGSAPELPPAAGAPQVRHGA
ncbi:ethanolamine ammonia-lyase subunit EutC [Streptomyces sp. NBC_00102]|uniref:ethanolamine ammonia-lyase subunit EutC n=1 Tax=Streptomyces sp. NBC_00102 TaxID=2975652 RepID=UPI0022580341|nr:ethanolamine ammonia-lyase subunit EutC [Streptomyces sp. NBC_00102]MCX5395997.1 ethanolamine ammonia-lyase subunit EutC [Streptomyces sp. NBC_00102]